MGILQVKNKMMNISMKQKRVLRELFKNAGLYLVLSMIALVFLFPFVWMIVGSLKDRAAIFLYPPRIFPNPAKWENYIELFKALPFANLILNSFKISILSVIGVLFSCSLAAYAFARLKFRGRDTIFFLILLTMIIPGEVTMIPVFLIMKFLGWVNTHLPLIVPSFFGDAFGIFMLRQFFLGIPRELEDAATLDGASHFDIYWRIFLPLGKPALVSLAVLTFMWRWEALLQPVIYLSDFKKMTVTVGLATFAQDTGMQGITQWHLLMAGILVSTIPILIFFVIAQRYFVQGIVMTGIKE